MNKLNNVISEVNKVIKGKNDVVTKVFAAIIAGGHVLMEDIPGVGKTTLCTSFAKTLSMSYRRMQLTPDVLPSDILGFSLYNSNTKEFEFKPGPIFCNFFLADEINRTSPKTQSALLEVMEEGHVTVDGNTYDIDDVFVVIATQNPAGSAGTNLLPESQLDRFLVKLSMGYPDHNNEIEILKGNTSIEKSVISPVIGIDELKEYKKGAANIFVHDSIYEYVAKLCEETRNNPLFSQGVSPRGGIALLKMAKAYAYIYGQEFVTSEDVQMVIKDVFGHRVKLSSRAKSEGMSIDKAIDMLLKQCPAPRQ